MFNMPAYFIKSISWKLFIYVFYPFIYVVCACVCVKVYAHTCNSQRTMCRCWLSHLDQTEAVLGSKHLIRCATLLTLFRTEKTAYAICNLLSFFSTHPSQSPSFHSPSLPPLRGWYPSLPGYPPSWHIKTLQCNLLSNSWTINNYICIYCLLTF